MAPHTPPAVAHGVIDWARPGGLPYQPMSARRRVKMVLHRGIVTGTIPGGTRLVQSSVAAELAVSTRSVREALTELAAEGFVRFDQRGGGGGPGTCPPPARDNFQNPMIAQAGPPAPAPRGPPPGGPGPAVPP